MESAYDEAMAEAKAILARVDRHLAEASRLDAQLEPGYSGPVYTYVAGVLVDTASSEYAAWYDRVYGGNYEWYDAA